MSGAEALEVKKDFLKNCLSELKKVSKPRFELELELYNMYAMKEFKDMADEISLGCVVKVNPDRYMQEENVAFDIRLTKIEFSFDDVDSISVTFSSKKLLDEFYMEDIFKMAESSHSYVSFNNTNIKNATAQTKITKGTIEGSMIKGSTYFTENTSTGSAMRIYDGNIFIEGNNGYIRGIVGTDSFSKLIGISSEDNMVIGHDTAVSSIYGGKRIDINMYTDNFKIRQSSDGGTPTVKIGSYNVIHAGNIDNYLSNYATTSQLSSLESRVSSLESKS